MVCPPALVDDFVERKALLNNGSPWLTQAVLARYFDENCFARHLQALRRRYQAQRDELLCGIRKIWAGRGRVSGQNSGMHLAFELPADSPGADILAAAALAQGVRLYPLAQAAASAADDAESRHLLFGYAGLETGEIAQAMARVHAACRQMQEASPGRAEVFLSREEASCGGV